ncbi:MAG: alpha/beta hydrolase domain-containing protein [Steroidobacteraceae bacterium]
MTPTSRPFLSARQSLQPVELATRGYVEEEFLLTGQASIYDWAPLDATDGPVRVRASNVPYTTRFLLRRPADAKKFSGRVIVELLNPTNQYDIAPLWGLSHEHFVRNGDVYVGVSIKPLALQGLQKFNAQRYAKVSFAYNQAAECAAGAPPAGFADDNSPTSENGLAWDVIAQMGALLRSSSRDNPLGDYKVRQVLAGGYSQTGGYLITYINALHARLRLGTGAPVYDGYLQATGNFVAAPLNQCSAPLAAEDPRRRLGPHDVPVVYVNTQSDFALNLALRRPDSDAPDDRFRQYELPGVGHDGPWPAGRPADADLRALDLQRFDSGERCGAPATDLEANASYNAVWSLLQNWVADLATVPPASRLIDVDDKGAAVLDAHGNARGGLRLPFLDVPVASYAGSSATTSQDPRVKLLCMLSGSAQKLDAAALKAMYRTKAQYIQQFGVATDALVNAHAVLPIDAAALKAQAAKIRFPGVGQ